MPRYWRYPSDLADALRGLGVSPTPETPPSLVRDAVNDLYRYELRRLRESMRTGVVQRASYVDLVIALRKKYWMLTLPPHAWDRICAPGTRDEASGPGV